MEDLVKSAKDQGNSMNIENNCRSSNVSSQDHSIKGNVEDMPRKTSITSINSTCYNSTGTLGNSPFANNMSQESQIINLNLNQNGFLLYHYNQSNIEKLKNEFQNYKTNFNKQTSNYINDIKKDIQDKNIRLISLKQKQNMKKDLFKKKKINYLELLIDAADNLLNTGFNLKDLHLHKKMNLKKIQKKPNCQSINTLEKKNETFKCGNKICPEIVAKKSNLFYANIYSAKKSFYLCNFCYQAYQCGQYCYYCGIIYRKYKGTKGFNNHMTWIGCEFCSNWVHIQCEEANGVYKNLSKIIKRNKDFLYKCPVCRKKEESKNIIKDNIKKEIKNLRKRRSKKKYHLMKTLLK